MKDTEPTVTKDRELSWVDTHGATVTDYRNFNDGWDYFHKWLAQARYNTSRDIPAAWGPGTICTLSAIAWPVGRICEECGHHAIVHPGPNRIDACLLCEVNDTLTMVRAFVADMM